MDAVHYEDAFNYLINFTQDFSVVNGNDWNIVHCIAHSPYDGDVRSRIFFGGDDDARSRMLMKLSEKTNVESLINNKDHNGRTPLHFAARFKSHGLIETIVKLGGDVNIKDNDNRLPDEQDRCDGETKRILQRLR